MVEYLFRLIVKCQKRQVVAKVRAIEMALKLVALSNVVFDWYQREFIVCTDNTDNKITQIFYPCNYFEVKLDGFCKSRQRFVSIGWITDFYNAPFSEWFHFQATLPELKLGVSKCVVVLIRKTTADFVLEIEQHVDDSVLRS